MTQAAEEGRSHTVPVGGHKRQKREPKPHPMAVSCAPKPSTRTTLELELDTSKVERVIDRALASRGPLPPAITITLSAEGVLRVEIVPCGGGK